ncbi:MAG: hypothetical protein QOI06_2732 [Nocardioidaceae bacterium]|jgi:hypothetical protein|nr:hypothetical protein [Nocardioidaceae bacterium]
MTEAANAVDLCCPHWCRSHGLDASDRFGGGVTALHESDVLTWSDDGSGIAGIRAIDEYADGHLAGIYIANATDHVWDITADQARRLAAVLVTLADEFDG